jgi:hypothetical protein
VRSVGIHVVLPIKRATRDLGNLDSQVFAKIRMPVQELVSLVRGVVKDDLRENKA